MSMLTPPGMGGKYRITGNRYPRMRRPRNRRRIVLASTAAVAALSVGGWGTLQLIDIFSGGSSANAAGSSAKGKGGTDCATDAKSGTRGGENTGGKSRELPEPGSIKVNVLNATDRSGLAKSIADKLKKRGFKIGDVANAPDEFDKKVENAGVLLGAPGKEGDTRLKVLGTHFTDVDTRFDDRKGDDVDFIIGKAYDKLADEKEAAKARTALGNPKPSSHSRGDCEK
ncbi:LytR C-terminal domain-containing protein [Streptomyces sp. HNM0575]|uniref:LytR C-terminal domain-containing protein n=1 Tax=Streptomyces sp. HNM0575 TaxID=2716338 RepID=UPI00145D7B5E|nr:LytR C-terminal domain-containing protein [Streptomyces sp. HNM0575]NLU75652.1 LytR C-terminal domain-containing protein [Streptomyces sp. HNM0575]